MMIFEIIAILCSYMLGTIPTGLLVGKMFGKGDIRKQGSGNIGATNTLRVAGKKAGIITLVIDVVKGALPVFIAAEYFSTIETNTYVYCGIAAVVGHMFPIWLSFKGGKGVATAFGAVAAVNADVGIVLMISFIISFLPFRVVSIASLTTTLIATIFAVFFMEGAQSIMVWVIAVLIFFKHRANIQRILAGEEKKI